MEVFVFLCSVVAVLYVAALGERRGTSLNGDNPGRKFDKLLFHTSGSSLDFR